MNSRVYATIVIGISLTFSDFMEIHEFVESRQVVLQNDSSLFITAIHQQCLKKGEKQDKLPNNFRNFGSM
jgi:hypothetical protein